MIVPGQHLIQVYQAIKKDSHGSEDQSVLCFAACSDVDSVCSAQQLLSLFNRDNLHFTLIPVNTYEQVKQHCESLITAEEVKTVLLVNCGATDDVRSLCELPDNVRIVIVDHHRPVWHGHNNESDMDTLVLVDDDDPVPKGSVPMFDPKEQEDLDDEDSDASDEEEEDGEADVSGDGEDGEEDIGGGPGRKRRRRRHSNEDDPAGRAARRSPAARVAAAAERRRRAEAVDAYYSDCNGYGKPSSMLIHSLCHQLQHDDNFHLWLAILGLTEQVIFQQISKQQYAMWREVLANHVRVVTDANQEDVEQEDLLIMPRHKVQIELYEDLRLTLLKHWTIEDSLRYTGYVAARLQTWRQKGLDNLRSLLTYMCIPLKHASTSYKGLREVYNGQLRSQLPRFAPQHMLAWDSLHLNSFRLMYKHEELSASDMVFSLLGLLTEVQPGQKDGHRTAFNNASSALHVQRNLHVVERGIDLAKQMCQDVVHEGGLMITSGKIQGGRNADYRWVDVAESNGLANPRFTHPAVLKYMALFLRDASSHRYSSNDARRPMVVAGPPDEHGMGCVVAVHAKHISGNRLQMNPFARPFIETAAGLGIFQHKSAFENTTFYLKKDEVRPYLDRLQHVVKDYKEAAQQLEQAAQA